MLEVGGVPISVATLSEPMNAIAGTGSFCQQMDTLALVGDGVISNTVKLRSSLSIEK